MNPLFQPCLCDLIARHAACVMVCGSPPPGFGQPEEPEGQSGWAPGSLSDDSWVGSGNLALKELSAEISLLFTRISELEGESWALPCQKRE